MRIFEILIIITLIASNVLLFIKKEKWFKYSHFLTTIFLILHIILEGMRWQLSLIYLIILFYILKTFINIKMNKVINIITAILIILSTLLALIFPVQNMIKPTGEYKVGTETFELTDSNRKAIYSDNLNNQRKIKFQIWYPTNET